MPVCIVYVRSKKTVKKTVRSNCNPDLLSASFGPSQRLRISVHHIPSCAHTSIHALPNRTISSSSEHTECVVSSPFPPPNFLVLEPFPPDSLLRSHPLLASENRGPHSGRQGIELPSPCFSIQLEKRARQEWWAFRRLSPTFPKTTQGTGGGWKGNFSFPLVQRELLRGHRFREIRTRACGESVRKGGWARGIGYKNLYLA